MAKHLQTPGRLCGIFFFLLLLLSITFLPVSAMAPVADFTGLPTSGTAPLPVSFTDLSLNTPTGWAWFFGDENYSQPWTQVNASAGWTGVMLHSSVAVLDNNRTDPFAIIDEKLAPAEAAALKSLIQNTLHAFSYNEATGDWYARNAANRITFTYSKDGTAEFSDKETTLGLTLTGIGREGAVAPAVNGTARANGRQLDITRPEFTEWYRNNDDNVEQGMTIQSRPSGEGPLQVRFGLTSDGSLSLVDDQTLTVIDASGTPLFTYTGLHALSADGRELPAFAATDGTTLSWVVDDTGAVYPVTIDPVVVSASAATATFTGGAANDYFGDSVSLSSDGTRVLVGAHYNKTAGTGAGAAYLFDMPGGGWSGTTSASAATATFTGGAASDSFGTSVSLSSDGTRALVGAISNKTAGTGAGAAYLFDKPGGGWSGTTSASAATATFTGGAANDYFGSHISLSSDGTRALVGVYPNDTAGTDAGAAYIFQPPYATLTAGGITSGAAGSTVNGLTLNPTGTLKNIDLFLGTSSTTTSGSAIKTGITSLPVSTATTVDGVDLTGKTAGTYYLIVNQSGTTSLLGATGTVVYTVTAPAPVAGFTANVTSGTAPLLVQFNDTSTNTPTAWNWSFRNVTPGNNTQVWWSTSQNATQTFGAGNFAIVLNVSNSGGYNISTQVTFINVTAAAMAPVADFTGTPNSGTAPLNVTFTDSSTNSPTEWNWSFGDNDTTNSTIQNPVHTYTIAGTYTVSLNATNIAGYNTTSKPAYITVTAASAAPVAEFTGTPTSGTAPLNVTFTDSSTNSPTEWNWSFGDGSYCETRNPSHIYTGAGTFTVSLNATNTAGSNTINKAGYITVSSGGGDGGGNGGGGGGGGGGGSGGGGGGPVFVEQPGQEPQQPEAPEIAPLTPEEQPVEGLAGLTFTESYPVGFEGLSFNTDGQNSVSLDISAAEQAGATVTTFFDRVEVYQHGSPGVRITFFFDTYNQTAKFITGTAKRAEFETDPLVINVSAGKVAGSVHAVLTSISQPVKVENSITGNVTVGTAEKFRTVLAQDNLAIAGIAYLMDFQRGKLTSTGAANVTLTVPASWVDQHGGKDAVRIARISDTTGTTELINTVYTGADPGGNMVFRGDSPHGTSIFGLLTAKATAAKQIEEPNVTIQPLQKPAVMTEIGMFAWLLGIVQQNPVVLVIVIAVIGMVAYFVWWRRRV